MQKKQAGEPLDHDPEGKHLYATDSLPIEITGVGFSHKQEDPILRDVTLDPVTQGSIIVVAGVHRTGKSTLLKMIAGTLDPQKGSIFIPTHLRVLQVSQDPYLMNMSLRDNLLFGSQTENIERVEDILRQMECGHVSPFLEQPRDDWYRKLSYTDLACIHLARAFIVNPEVLVMHRPTIHFESGRRDAVWRLLTEFVENRGVCMPEEGREHRRPRTVFLSTADWADVKKADRIIFCHNQTATQCKSADDIEQLRVELKQGEGAGAFD
jgi:ABC-type multidrug transport system fused ATPase/permease subunit